MYQAKLKSNEQVTMAFDRESERELQSLRFQIVRTTLELKKMQAKHKQMTGKVLGIF